MAILVVQVAPTVLTVATGSDARPPKFSQVLGELYVSNFLLNGVLPRFMKLTHTDETYLLTSQGLPAQQTCRFSPARGETTGTTCTVCPEGGGRYDYVG